MTRGSPEDSIFPEPSKPFEAVVPPVSNAKQLNQQIWSFVEVVSTEFLTIPPST